MKVRLVGLLLCLLVAETALGQRQMERLTRGVVAVRQADGGVYIGWRLFGTDPEEMTFNVYRLDGKTALKINDVPISGRVGRGAGVGGGVS
jgi:rhamnogalacturonan endolyase